MNRNEKDELIRSTHNKMSLEEAAEAAGMTIAGLRAAYRRLGLKATREQRPKEQIKKDDEKIISFLQGKKGVNAARIKERCGIEVTVEKVRSQLRRLESEGILESYSESSGSVYFRIADKDKADVVKVSSICLSARFSKIGSYKSLQNQSVL